MPEFILQALRTPADCFGVRADVTFASVARREFFRSPSVSPTPSPLAPVFPLHEPTGAHMNKDQIKGSAKEVKGKVKEIAGRVIGNPRVEAEGDDEQIIGKVQKTYGDIKNEANKSR